jgi:hypothetical protein
LVLEVLLLGRLESSTTPVRSRYESPRAMA